MYIIAGLGNPEKKYMNTRHNIGFDVIDAIAEKNDIVLGEKKHKAVIGKGIAAGQKVVLVKPLTYMNLSGESIRSVIDFYKVDEKSELIVISDDVSLDMGQIRMRKRGSDGGHNGLKNIIYLTGRDDFPRVKIGVGQKPHPDYDLADWVLGKFSPQDAKTLEGLFSDILPICQLMAEGRADEAMSKYNRTGPTPPQRGEEKTL